MSGLQRRLGIFVAVAMASLAALSLLNLADMRRRTIEDAQAQTSNLSQSLADQAHDALLTLDTVLIGLRERVETDGLQQAARERLDRVLALRAASLGIAHRISVLDEWGQTVATSDRSAPNGAAVNRAGVAALAFFRSHRGAAERGMLVGWPVRDWLDGQWVLTVSRRVDRPDGGFGGVVVASLPTALFSRSYARFDMGGDGAIMLGRASGQLVSRWPMAPSDEGRDLSGGEFFRRILRPGDQARTEHRSLMDGTVRFGSYHWVRGAPLFVLTARSKSDVLAGWRREALLQVAGLLVMTVILGVLARKLFARIAEAERVRRLLAQSNARLTASEARMARANRFLEMGEQIAQIGHWQLDVVAGRLTWSDEVYRLYDQQPGLFTPTVANALEAYHPDEREIVAGAVAECIKSGRCFELISRLVRPDGTIRHVLSRGVPHADGAGRTASIFGIVMDITRQRGTEAALLKAHAEAEAANEALAAANRALETMAMQDALTGLANRRHFDRALEREFRRAMRAGHSLALVMIDVDHFKRYNDLYGHPAGDSCLRAVGGLIPPLLNRPGDTAARYGGEEIAILLPGIDEAGAFSMASRLVDAVRELALAHDGSGTGVVTISAGVHAMVPVHDRDVSCRLVAQTDRALYAAKHAGRDRVICFSNVGRGAKPAGLAMEEGAMAES